VTAIQNRKFIGAVMRYYLHTQGWLWPNIRVRDVIERPEVEHARPLENKNCEFYAPRLTHIKDQKPLEMLC
jgi:hypothetical protein